MTKKYIYLDDNRTPFSSDWIVVRNYDEFVKTVESIGFSNIELVSLDHDLGDTAIKEWYTNTKKNGVLDYSNIEEKTGFDCVKWMVEKWMDGEPVFEASVHSANPVGSQNMISYINNYYKSIGRSETCKRVKIHHFVIPNLEYVISVSGVHPLKVRDVYLFGSRVYGYGRGNSDFDIVMVAPGLIPKEIKDPVYNVHQVMPDDFMDSLENYEIRALECYYAPSWARLKEKTEYKLEINPDKLIGSILSQSHEMWRHSKMKMNEGDVHRGNKSAFHSMKSLIFGASILKTGTIDFDLKSLHKEFMDNHFYEWSSLKRKYLEKKIELENTLKESKN
jgi:hypothetical protein